MDYQDHFYQLLITDHGYLLRTYFFDFAKVQDLLPLRMLNHNRRQLSRYFECYHFFVSPPPPPRLLFNDDVLSCECYETIFWFFLRFCLGRHAFMNKNYSFPSSTDFSTHSVGR
jgi:hypothetical protein